MRSKDKHVNMTLKPAPDRRVPGQPKKAQLEKALSPKAKDSTSHHNEFELVCKIKNSKTHNQEQSYQSLIMLKNKIKRFSNKTKQDDKQKQKPSRYESTSSGQGQTLDIVFKRIQRKLGEQHQANQANRLGNFVSLDKKRNTVDTKSKGKKNSKHGGPVSAGCSQVDKPLKRTKSAQIQPKTQQSAEQQKRRQPLAKIMLKKSPRYYVNSPQLKSHCQDTSKISNPRSSKHPLQSSKRQKQSSRSRHLARPYDKSQYILFDNEIVMADNNVVESEMNTLMRRSKEINVVDQYERENEEEEEEDANDEEDYELVRQFYQAKAIIIQKFWRGWLARRHFKKILEIKRKEDKQKIQTTQTTPKQTKREMLLPPPVLHPSLEPLFEPEDTKQLERSHHSSLPSSSEPLQQKLGLVMSEIQHMENPKEKEQALLRLKAFVKGKEPQKSPSDLTDDVSQTLSVRENAIELRLSTQISILKKLKQQSKLKDGQYERRLIEAQRWAYQEKQQIDRLRMLLKDNLLRAAEIVKKTHEDIILVEKVKNGQQDQTVLNKVLDSLPSAQNDLNNYFFFPEPQNPGPQRPKSTGCHMGSPDHRANMYAKRQNEQHPHPENQHNYNIHLKQILEQFRQRQKVKNECEKRIAIQMSYLKSPLADGTINTSMQTMHTFLTNFFRFVVYYYKHEFLRFINMPYGFSPERRIKFLQGYDFTSEEEEEMLDSGMIEGVEKVISIEIFEQFQQHYLQQRKQQQDKSILYQCIHNRAVFDAFNEALNLFRPYFSINGPPYLWNTSQKALTFYFIAQQNIEQVFEKTKYKVMKCSSGLCGLLATQYEGKPVEINNDLLDLKSNCHKVLGECREERLLKTEKHHIQETDFQWFLFEEEKTQIMFELGTVLLNQLIRQVCSEMRSLI